MREVDDHWPAVGVRLDDSVGSWPLLLDDATEVVEVVPGSSLTLHAKARARRCRGGTIRLEPSVRDPVVIEEDAPRPPPMVPKVLRDVRSPGEMSRPCAVWRTSRNAG